MKPRFVKIFLPALILVTFAYAQDVDPFIAETIQSITVESYSAHFDSLRVSEGHSRKVEAVPKQSDDHDACRDYIYRQFIKFFGDTACYLHRFDSFKHKGLTNVIGFKQGADPSLGIWIVCAHYDSNNNLSKDTVDNIPAPGANDNGTGLAAVLEIARVVSELEIAASVLFVAWDLEEIYKFGYPVGSNKWFRKYVKRFKSGDIGMVGKGGVVGLKDIRGCLNFDMFGKPQPDETDSSGLWVCYSKTQHHGFAQDYAEAINAYSPEANAVVFDRMNLSDHFTFASRSIPSVENLESAFCKDPYYHSSMDHIQNINNIDYEFSTNITKGGCAFLLENVTIISSPAPK